MDSLVTFGERKRNFQCFQEKKTHDAIVAQTDLAANNFLLIFKRGRKASMLFGCAGSTHPIETNHEKICSKQKCENTQLIAMLRADL